MLVYFIIDDYGTPDITSSITCNVGHTGNFVYIPNNVSCLISASYLSSPIITSTSSFNPGIYALPEYLTSSLLLNSPDFLPASMLKSELELLGYNIDTVYESPLSRDIFGIIDIPIHSDQITTIPFTFSTGTYTGIFAIWDGVSANVCLVAVLDQPDQFEASFYF